VDEIVKGIETLLTDREYGQELGRCAKKTAEGITWEKATDKFCQCYSGNCDEISNLDLQLIEKHHNRSFNRRV
jgi:hypothetical protein